MINRKAVLPPSAFQTNQEPCRVPWEATSIREKQDNMKSAFSCNKRNPTNANAQKLKAQGELPKKQLEYILDQINKIKNLIE